MANARSDQVGWGPEAASHRTSGPLGVVFVHGLGSQPRGETLLNWSGPIIRAISRWAANTPGVKLRDEADCVIESRIDFEGATVPLVEIEVPAGNGLKAQTWIMTEAWWAQRVAPPSLATMIDWCGRQGVVAGVVERLITHLGEGPARQAERWQRNDGHDRAARPGVVATTVHPFQPGRGRFAPVSSGVSALSKLGFGLFLSAACTILLLLYAAARTLAAFIPIQTVRDALTRFELDTLLTRWWGSAYLLLVDPVQSANIRGQLARSIEALRSQGCGRIAIIAHSGGTIVSYLTLSDPAYDVRADLLITHGEAISMGRVIAQSPRLEGQVLRLGGGVDEPGGWLDFWATHDPAPCGKLSPEFGGSGTSDWNEEVIDSPDAANAYGGGSICVWNRRSVLDDHGSYWDNDEEFVYPVIAALDMVAGGTARSRFRVPVPERGESWVQRRRQRVAMLTLLVRMLFVVPIVAAVGAFVLGDPGMVRSLGQGAYSFIGSIQGVPDLASGIAGFRLASPWSDATMFVGLFAIAILVLVALVHAALPIRQEAVWPDLPRRGAFLLLDLAPAGVIAVVAGLAIPRFFSWVGGHDLSGILMPLAGVATLAVAVLVVVVAISRLKEITPLRGLAGEQAAVIAAALLAAVVVVVGSIAYALILDEGIRTWVTGTLVAFLGFQALGAIGRWRWNVWDQRERDSFRELGKQPSRRWPAVQIALIATAAMLGGATILLDWPFGWTLTLSTIGLLVVVSVLRDAALRAMPIGRATRPREPEPSARVGQAGATGAGAVPG